jgi:hypothetical protein
VIVNTSHFDFIFGPHGSSLFILDDAHECDSCHTMKKLFVARPAQGAVCLVCDNPRREQAEIDAWLLESFLPEARSLKPEAPPTKEAPCSARPAVAS